MIEGRRWDELVEPGWFLGCRGLQERYAMEFDSESIKKMAAPVRVYIITKAFLIS